MINWQVFNSGNSKPETRNAEPVPLPRAGAGTLMTVNAFGVAHSVASSGPVFDHAWRPALAPGRITFRLGTVRSVAGVGPVEPQIRLNGELLPMSGKNGTTPTPLLPMSSKP